MMMAIRSREISGVMGSPRDREISPSITPGLRGLSEGLHCKLWLDSA